MNDSNKYNKYNEFVEILYKYPSRFDISNSLVINGSFVVTNEKFKRESIRYSYSMKDVSIAEYRKIFSKFPSKKFNAIKFFIQRILCDSDENGFGIFNDIYINCNCSIKTVGETEIWNEKRKIFVKPNDIVKLSIDLIHHKLVPLIFDDFDQFMLFISQLKHKYNNYQTSIEKTYKNSFIDLDDVYEFNDEKFDEYLSMINNSEYSESEVSQINKFFDCDTIKKYFGDIKSINYYRKIDEETGDGLGGIVHKRFENGKEIKYIGDVNDYDDVNDYLENYSYGKQFEEIFDFKSFKNQINEIYQFMNDENIPKLEEIYKSLKSMNKNKIMEKVCEIEEENEDIDWSLNIFYHQYFHIIKCYIGLKFRLNTVELSNFYKYRGLFNKYSEDHKLDYNELVQLMNKFDMINK